MTAGHRQPGALRSRLPERTALSDASREKRVEKPWGHELIWARTDRYAGKILVIEAGERLSLQLHRHKDESILVLEGRLRLTLEDERGDLQMHELGPGEHRHVPRGRRHRFEALRDVKLVEVSSPELDDVVRLEDDYGRVVEEGS